MFKGKSVKSMIVVTLFLTASITLLYSNLGFYGFTIYEPRPQFWDLYNATILWRCYEAVGLDLFLASSSPVDLCRNFNYGYFSILSMGLTTTLVADINFWGFLQIIFFVILITRVYLQDNLLHQNTFYLIALFSPGVFLLYASGNMDMQIVCLLLVASQLILFRIEKSALTLICVTVLFKFYTAPVLLVAVFLVKRKTSQVYGALLILLTSSLIWYQFVRTPLVSFPDGAQNKFGSGIFDNYARKAGVQMSKLQGELLGLLLLLVALMIITYCYKKFSPVDHVSLAKLTKKEEQFSLNFLIMGGASITCYLAALNVDYRLTFIALAGIALLMSPYREVKYISSVFPYCWLLSLWISFPFAGLKEYIGIDIQPLGDLFMIGTIAYFIFQGFFTFRSVFYRRKIS